MSEAATPNAGSVDVAVGIENGQVVVRWHKPTTLIVFDPQNAFTIGEAMARAAHQARFPGQQLPDDVRYLAQQVRARVTEELRDRMVARVAIVMGNLYQKKWTPGKASLELVDIVLSMAQGKTV